MSELPVIVVLSGSGAPAIAAANIYFRRLSSHFRVVLVEERNLTRNKVVAVLRRRLRDGGLTGVADLVFLRLWLQTRKGVERERQYSPTLHCEEINGPAVIDLISRQRPSWIVTNACSIVRDAVFNASNCSMLNVHNGVTPRYRGTGNFWAVREDNPSLLGVTVHRLDSGIDTGERVSVASMRVDDPRCSTLDGLDVAAFEDGANLVCDHVLQGRSGVPPEFLNLSDGYYSYPGLSDWIAARRVLRRWRTMVAGGESVWQASFAEYACDDSKDSYQRMHWGSSETVEQRDAQVIDLLSERISQGDRLLDIGGGDGRLARRLPQLGAYICADYTHAFLQQSAQPRDVSAWAVQCDARELPFSEAEFDAAVAVGLFQHITEAQKVADELRSAVRSNGYLIVNTLRQFSRTELLLILAASVFSPNIRPLALAIWRQDYFSGLMVDGTLVARRYSLSGLLRLFTAARNETAVRYSGVLGTRFFSREITVVLRNH